MASARSISELPASVRGDGNIEKGLTVEIYGTDVPNTILFMDITFNYAPTATLAQIGTAAAAAIRNFATSQGITIGAGNVKLPSYSGL